MADRLSRKEYICPRCGNMGRAEVVLRGSASLERFMWYVLLFPGPIYSLYRHLRPRLRCRQCRRDEVVELDTPEGLAIMEKVLRAGGGINTRIYP